MGEFEVFVFLKRNLYIFLSAGQAGLCGIVLGLELHVICRPALEFLVRRVEPGEFIG